MVSDKLPLKNSKLYKECMGSLVFGHLATSQLSKAIFFAIACKELKIAQIAQIKQLFQLLNFIFA